MKPTIVEKQGFTIIGLKYEGKNENNEILQLWDEFMQKVHTIENRINPNEFFGYDTWTEKIKETGEFTYLSATEVEDDRLIPEGMDCIKIPASKYAVFTLVNKDVHKAVQEVFSKWLPESGCKMSGNYDFEYYDENYHPHNEDAKIYFYIPIE